MAVNKVYVHILMYLYVSLEGLSRSNKVYSNILNILRSFFFFIDLFS